MKSIHMMAAGLALGAAAHAAEIGKSGTPMVVTAGNDVGWQVASMDEARKAFAERGELRGGLAGLQGHWAAHLCC